MGRVVVGVDGSEQSILALRWAMEEASVRQGWSVEAIITWTYPVMATDGFSGGAGLIGLDPAVLAEGARQRLESAIQTACPDEPERQRIKRTVQEGGAGHALVEASRGAQLLVVGSRGHGGFADLLLGSVSSQCVHHAHCPVTVIRPPS